MNNQECKIRPRIVNVNSDEPVFFPFIIKTSKCSGTCNYINDTFAKLCVPNMAKIIKLKVFNLMSRTGETRHIKFYETCKCKCRLDASVYNNIQRWNEEKYKRERKELIDKGVFDKSFIWNRSNWECECDKPCDIGEYLYYESCICRKRLVDKLVEESNETDDEVKIAKITWTEEENKHRNKCSSCTLYIVFSFQWFLQLTLGLVLVSFTANTCIMIKNSCLKRSYLSTTIC